MAKFRDDGRNHALTWAEVHRDTKDLARELDVRIVDTLCISSYDEQVRERIAVLKTPEKAAENGGEAIFFGRFIPVISFNLLNYAAGLMRLPWWTFGVATGLGILPLTILMVFMGAQMKMLPWQVWLLLPTAGLVLGLATHFVLKRLKAKRNSL